MPPPVVKTIQERSLADRLVFGAIVSCGSWPFQPDQFFRAYLIGYMDWLGVTWDRWRFS